MSVDVVIELFKDKKVSGNVSTIRKIFAAMIRRLKIRLNYKTWMIFDFATTIFMVFTYFLLSFIILPEDISKAGYGSSYFSFALIGIAISHYITASLRSLSLTIRLEQFYGTLESVLSTPTDFIILFLGDLMYFFFYSSIFLLIILPLGILLGAGLIINAETLLTLLVLVVLLMISNLPIGIVSAAMVLKFKQGNPIGWALTWINQFFAGTFFPVTLLPDFLRVFSLALPLTYSLDAIRYSLIWGVGLLNERVLFDVAIMLIYSIVGYPIAVKIFRKIYDDARKTGKLGIY